MLKISKKLMNDFKATKKVVKKAKNDHNEIVDKISEIIKPLIEEKYYSNAKTNWNITKIQFCNDNSYKIKDLATENEWVKISEKEYERLFQENKKNNFFKSIIKTEEIFEPEYEEFFYKQDKKRLKYLRVYVYEWWNYGGYDNLEYDFLLSDIMDDQYLRKEKLKKLEKI